MNLDKQRHHYVPQFWMRRFRDSRNVLYQWDGRLSSVASPSTIMQQPWLNTTFNAQWQASNQLEDNLSKLESIAASFFTELDNPSVTLTEQHRELLCEVLALQACRHPDVFNMGHRKAAKLATLLADIPLMDTEAQFTSEAIKLGMPATEAATIFQIFRSVDPDALEQQALVALAKSPQDPDLPYTDALLAMDIVAMALKKLSYELVTAPADKHFVLGDTPLPQSELSLGFVVPLSKSLAVVAQPSVTTPTISCRAASAQEVADCNRKQWEMAAQIVVGPDPAVLVSLGPR